MYTQRSRSLFAHRIPLRTRSHDQHTHCPMVLLDTYYSMAPHRGMACQIPRSFTENNSFYVNRTCLFANDPSRRMKMHPPNPGWSWFPNYSITNEVVFLCIWTLRSPVNLVLAKDNLVPKQYYHCRGHLTPLSNEFINPNNFPSQQMYIEYAQLLCVFHGNPVQ